MSQLQVISPEITDLIFIRQKTMVKPGQKL